MRNLFDPVPLKFSFLIFKMLTDKSYSYRNSQSSFYQVCQFWDIYQQVFLLDWFTDWIGWIYIFSLAQVTFVRKKFLHKEKVFFYRKIFVGYETYILLFVIWLRELEKGWMSQTKLISKSLIKIRCFFGSHYNK